MLKVGPSWGAGRAWDHRGKSEIAEIIISRSQTSINFIHFLYVEDGGNKLVLSEKLGSGDGGSLYLNTVSICISIHHNFLQLITNGFTVNGVCDNYLYNYT